MKLKTFKGKNTTETLAKIKAELGDEAVILSNRTVDRNGRQVCEITAAVEGAGSGPSRDEYLDGALAGGAPWSREWGEIRSHLLALLRPKMDLARLSPRQRLALEFLEREGVEDSVLLDIFRELKDSPGSSILQVLDRIAPVKAVGNGAWPEKYQGFVGPHGSGKTWSLIRVALLLKHNSPKASICLASTDQDQGKGRMILRHYAELSGLTFRDASGRDGFKALTREGRGFDLVLIDLPGLSGPTNLEDQLTSLGMADGCDLALHLVMSPLFSPGQFEAFRRKYSSAKLKSLIWTKLDEACTYGAMINMAHASGLPVSALSFGAGLKNSLAPARRESLWRLVFKHQLPGPEQVPKTTQGGRTRP
ncbi:MAG: flagellar biosynthesis protein FlhF [Desulfovibrionaceae bacterium]|nr:flagellar biosynthesis protein FlhF [Desulfovibrionaceae bacterium]MDD4951092.1 flagellar biosynthesis protein FlhF [Desulfovibrionaceae bacterium]